MLPLRMQAVEAMRLGNEAAKFVSAAFPRPMELKFERVAQPFLLLHVNRCPAYSLWFSVRSCSVVQLPLLYTQAAQWQAQSTYTISESGKRTGWGDRRRGFLSPSHVAPAYRDSRSVGGPCSAA